MSIIGYIIGFAILPVGWLFSFCGIIWGFMSTPMGALGHGIAKSIYVSSSSLRGLSRKADLNKRANR